MDGWLQDLKVGWRSLARTPGFTLVVVLVMGLAIGVNTMVFSIANAFLFRTLATLRADAPLGVDAAALRWTGPRTSLAAWSERLGAPALHGRAAALAATPGR